MSSVSPFIDALGEIVGRFDAREITREEAVQQLASLGFDPDEAEEILDDVGGVR